MSGFWTWEQKELARPTTKQEVIEAGLAYLEGVGADLICKVCIPGGGSCCVSCPFLGDGVGCGRRNTSCTAWLCGFLKFIYYEAGLIREWEDFWDEVPGQHFRYDTTPRHFVVRSWLEPPQLRFLCEAFADDLRQLRRDRPASWLVELKGKLDWHIDEILDNTNPKFVKRMEAKLYRLTSDFQRYHRAKAQLN
ncbi:hypothetical protein [Paenibacillus ehimensis]|uniref:hypothetical protein n=1 Tax=Paenibacillus ehimensis TaxID=79264 RepID=UPI000FD7C74C|nr:hypothetical protein [Paenibacillus ehimensis]